MMFVSMLELSRSDSKALGIVDPYSLHRVVYSLYDDIRTEKEKVESNSSGILYVEKRGNEASRKILLLSNRRPAERVDGKYGVVMSKVVPATFLEASTYRFSVLVNPTRRDSKSRKLIAIRGREAISDWFIERSETSWGFAVEREELQVDKIEVLQFKAKSQRQITLGRAAIRGTLSVRVRDQFKKSFASGIGRARTFGCGLLELVPMSD